MSEFSGLILAGIGTQFLLYHAAKLVIAPHGLCPCLGSAWKWVGLSETGATQLAICLALIVTAAGVPLMVEYGRSVEKA